MPSINTRILKASLLFVLLSLIIFYFYSLFHRTVNGDEAIIAEHAYWLNKIGFVRSQMFDGLGLGWENREYHYHKLFVLIGALMFHFFGISLFALRFISVVFTFIGLYFMALYSKEKSEHPKKYFFLVSASILLLNFTFYNYSFIYRPKQWLWHLVLGVSIFYIGVFLI